MTSLLVSLALSTLTACGFLVAYDQAAHWFLIPLVLCGIVIGWDAVDWFRGRLSLYDPAGIIGQPEPQWFFHRPISALFRLGFEAGFVVDGIEEPRLPEADQRKAGIRWHDMPDMPPIMVVRMTLMPARQPSARDALNTPELTK